MKDIKNTTQRAVRVPLPRGKVLHLGPSGTGQIAVSALEHPPLKKLLESGQIEILGEGRHESRHPFKREKASSSESRDGHGHTNVVHPSGDR